MDFQANDGPMNSSTPSNSTTSTGPGLSSSNSLQRPTVADAKARLLVWGEQADEGRAKLFANITSGVIPLVATGTAGVLGAFVARFFTRKRNKDVKPGQAAADKTSAPSSISGFLSIGSIIKVAVWLVPLILKYRAKSSPK